ncbi:MAG: 4Fe-4S ferredoxin [Desulfuromonas sp.]|nr:MAG: 4Fe-4S ferredoxin [Desulfuromonas sp.]
MAAAVRLYRQRRGETLPPLASASDVAVPERLRGAPRFAAAACVGCRVCAHVCAGGAIRFDDKEEGVALTLWENSCTFCGLCAHYCPSGALTLSNDWRRTHPQSQSYQQTVHGEVPQSPCSDCDASFTAAPPELLRRALGGTAAPIEPLRQLCPDCRRRHNLTFATRGVKR